MSKSGRENLWWFAGLFLLLLVQSRFIAGSMTGGWRLWGKNGGVMGQDKDPSYAIYERYRYAYDTYGYLFLSDETD